MDVNGKAETAKSVSNKVRRRWSLKTTFSPLKRESFHSNLAASRRLSRSLIACNELSNSSNKTHVKELCQKFEEAASSSKKLFFGETKSKSNSILNKLQKKSLANFIRKSPFGSQKQKNRPVIGSDKLIPNLEPVRECDDRLVSRKKQR